MSLFLIVPLFWLTTASFSVVLCVAAARGDAQGGQAAQGAARPGPPKRRARSRFAL
ncbi:MAG TPA: hypothetical protein VMA83_07140 [Solirubrobacteraceae bacterium]|nr:hypothetical protein [Solirubrobacteraceae bacterium]